jgi:hypothetical protein
MVDCAAATVDASMAVASNKAMGESSGAPAKTPSMTPM